MSDKKYTTINDANAAGRVEFTDGKAVWHWAHDLNDSTSILVKCLDNPELELEKTQRTPIVPARTADKTAAASPRRDSPDAPADDASFSLEDGDDRKAPGFDPYNRR